MKKKSLIVFDIDGTLTDSVSQHQKAFTESLYEIGVNEINSGLNSFKHHTDSFISKEIFEYHLKTPFSERIKLQFEKSLSDKTEQIKFNEINGAQKLIEKLENNSEFGICFATGSLRKPAEHKLNSIGVNYKSWQLVASDYILERENIVSKAINNSIENYNVEKFERIISVGDGLWDLLTAENLELEFIGVGETNRELLIDKGAKTVIKDLSEFIIPEKTYG